MPKRKDKEDGEDQEKELIAEDWCFICKDGGELYICDNKKCIKAYHPDCVGKEDASVMTSNKRWICKWHSCLICGRSSTIHCYCCPNAVCSRCIKKARFVGVNEKYGFCNDCLKLALLVEENKDVDSEGEIVDLKDRETYEGLYREYYEIIREQEGFDAETVRRAKIQFDEDTTDKSSSDFNGTDNSEDDMSFSADSDDSRGGRKHGHKKKKRKAQKTLSGKKEKSKRIVFVGWGSEALIWFLNSVGQDTKEELSMDDVERIILKYAKDNKLTHPKKRRKIICDSKLRSILRRKEVNKNSIPKILECHFAANQEDSEDDGDSCSDIEDRNEQITMTCDVERKKSEKEKPNNDEQKPDNYEQKPDKGILKKEKEEVVNIPQSCYAAIIPENIKLVYLKKSLVVELCKQPKIFEKKVVGSFVRVKSNPGVTRHGNSFQLEQVTGIRSASVGENSEVMLRVSNMPNDICLSMLSDADFSEEECNDLLQKVKAGLLKKPDLEELQEKARILHEDVTKHWIPRELAKLQHLINLANEKGWRRELFEYLDRRQKLQNQKEVSQLLQMSPVMIPDAGELGFPSEDIKEENGTLKELAPSIVAKDWIQEAFPGNETPNLQTNAWLATKIHKLETATADVIKSHDDEKQNQPMEVKTEDSDKMEVKTEDSDKPTTTAEVIESVDNEESKKVLTHENKKEEAAREDAEAQVWHICGMNEKNEKYNLLFLKKWSEANAQALKFEVWKEGQCEEKAIPLRDAVKLAFPR